MKTTGSPSWEKMEQANPPSLKIIAGASKASRGKVSAPKDAIIAYLPQHLFTEDKCTVFEEASKAFAKILDMKKDTDALNHQLETRTDYESDEYSKIIEQSGNQWWGTSQIFCLILTFHLSAKILTHTGA